jgi:hypothetical protein
VINPLAWVFGDDYDEPDDDFDRECGFPGCGCPADEVCPGVEQLGICLDCGQDFVQAQNGTWFCPECEM